MCVTNSRDLTLAVKVAFDLNTTATTQSTQADLGRNMALWIIEIIEIPFCQSIAYIDYSSIHTEY